MHVGFALLTLFPGRVGGSETNVRGLLGEFAAGNGPERVTVLANRHVMAAYGAAGPVEMHEVRSYRPGDGAPTRLLAMTAALAFPGRAARDVPGGLDLVHYPVTVPIPRTELPAVVTLLDVQHHDLPGFFSRAEGMYRRRAYDRAARDADAVVTISEFSKGRIAETLGIEPERIEVVHLGVDRGRFSPDGPPTSLDLPERFLLYPANAWPHKNHERLLEALALAPDVELVLTGQDYGRLGALPARARHLGHVPHEQLPALLRAATGLIFPSLYEGFGMPPLEAMACGCPAAVADAGALPEVVGEAAITFDPREPEAIAAAMRALWAGEQAPEPGLERARRFTWSAAAQRHREIYAGVLA